MAEIELHVLNGQCLNRHIPTIKKIKEEIKAWEKAETRRKMESTGSSLPKMPEPN
jgi:hypothetical protein